MIIDCISDLHGFKPVLQGGDLLILAGDYTSSGTLIQWADFFCWLKYQSYQKKILVAGNHDNLFESGFPENKKEVNDVLEIPDFLDMDVDFEYLCDSGTEYKGLKIWGSPWTPTFYDWHFMKDRGDPIKEMWDLIPDDTDILITHGPPLGIQDQTDSKHGKFAGCEELRNTINYRLKNLKLHVFGHIHEGYGSVQVNGVTYVNASLVDKIYRPVNKPIRFELMQAHERGSSNV